MTVSQYAGHSHWVLLYDLGAPCKMFFRDQYNISPSFQSWVTILVCITHSYVYLAIKCWKTHSCVRRYNFTFWGYVALVAQVLYAYRLTYVFVPANRMRKDCHAAHHDRGNVEEADTGGASGSNSTGNSSQSSSSQHTRDGTPQLQPSSQEAHQRAGICTIYSSFSAVFSPGAKWADAFRALTYPVKN